MTVIRNARVFVEGAFCNKDVAVDGPRIIGVGYYPSSVHDVDAAGCYLIPGMVDIHIHGSAGADFCDGTEQALADIANYLGSVGVSAFLGTSMAYDLETLTRAFSCANSFMSKQPAAAAQLCGINMEGPFFAMSKKGAQSGKYIIPPDIRFFQRLFEASGGAIKLLDLAPELDGAMELIAYASERCTVSIAHTEADYDTAVQAFEAGARHVTHFFNAMPPFSHRAPGVIGATADYAEMVELICDGVHLHPSAIRWVFREFGRERICLISDAMRACGLPEGCYDLGGQAVHVKQGRAELADGTLAGACTPLSECVRRAISFGIRPEEAIYSATAAPAKRAGIFEQRGSIEAGKTADLVLLNKDFTINRVMLSGSWHSQ